MRLLVINGPNINMLGIREPDIYGYQTYRELCDDIREYGRDKGLDISCFQSNHEGTIIDQIQLAYHEKFSGIIINPAGYSHTSIAILDALKAVNIPVIEVHLTDISKREEFRQFSYVSLVAKKTITGHGFKGYFMAIDYFCELNGK